MCRPSPRKVPSSKPDVFQNNDLEYQSSGAPQLKCTPRSSPSRIPTGERFISHSALFQSKYYM